MRKDRAATKARWRSFLPRNSLDGPVDTSILTSSAGTRDVLLRVPQSSGSRLLPRFLRSGKRERRPGPTGSPVFPGDTRKR